VLNVDSGMTQKEKVELVCAQLDGIGGARTIGFGADRANSLPDAIAKAIKKVWLNNDEEIEEVVIVSKANQSSQNKIQGTKDLCPECGYIELLKHDGCSICMNCGYGEC